MAIPMQRLMARSALRNADSRGKERKGRGYVSTSRYRWERCEKSGARSRCNAPAGLECERALGLRGLELPHELRHVVLVLDRSVEEPWVAGHIAVCERAA